MALTRYQMDAALVAPSRLRGVLLELGLSADAADGEPNPDLAEAIAAALESVGIVPADRAVPSDEDLARVGDALAPRLVDLAEIRALEGFALWLTARPYAERWPDWSVQRAAATGQMLDNLIGRKQARYDATWASAGRPRAAQLPRGIRHVLRLDRRGRRCRDRTVFDD